MAQLQNVEQETTGLGWRPATVGDRWCFRSPSMAWRSGRAWCQYTGWNCFYRFLCTCGIPLPTENNTPELESI